MAGIAKTVPITSLMTIEYTACPKPQRAIKQPILSQIENPDARANDDVYPNRAMLQMTHSATCQKMAPKQAWGRMILEA